VEDGRSDVWVFYAGFAVSAECSFWASVKKDPLFGTSEYDGNGGLCVAAHSTGNADANSNTAPFELAWRNNVGATWIGTETADGGAIQVKLDANRIGAACINEASDTGAALLTSTLHET
jgi:hypothetical protein